MQEDTDHYRPSPYAGDGFRHGIIFRRGHDELPHDPEPDQLDHLAQARSTHWQHHYQGRGNRIAPADVQQYKSEWRQGFQTSEEQDFPRPRQEMMVNPMPGAKLLLSGLCAVQFAPAPSVYYEHEARVRWPEGTRFSMPYETDYWQGPLVIDVLLPPAHQFPTCYPYMLWQPEQASIYGTTPPACNWGLHIAKVFPGYESTLGAIRREKLYASCRKLQVVPCTQSGCYAVYRDGFQCAQCGDFACAAHRSGSLCIGCLDHLIEHVAARGRLHRSSGLYRL